MALSLYLVSTTKDDGPGSLYLLVAESAAQAQNIIFDGTGYFEQIAEVGRLGKYEPGMEGHALVASRPQTAWIMSEKL